MPKSVRSFDRITIPVPCDADWDSMSGNDQVRFCEHCNLHVTDLSSMTRQEATRLVARAEGRLCVRYIQRPGGGILSKQVSAKLHPITRRMSRVAAGAFSATLSLSSAAAQTASQAEKPSTQVEQQPKSDRQGLVNIPGTASLSGVVTDPNGAVLAGATVVLTCNDSQHERTTTSSETGEYSFQSLAPGNCTLNFLSPGFAKAQITNILVNEGSSQRVDAKLEVAVI